MMKNRFFDKMIKRIEINYGEISLFFVVDKRQKKTIFYNSKNDGFKTLFQGNISVTDD